MVPERFTPLVQGLLCKNPKDRWTAVDCDKWMCANGIDSQENVGGTRKRDASPLPRDRDSDRRVKSDNTVATK